MFGGHLLTVGGTVRGLIVWLLPSWRWVRDWTWRLFLLGTLLAAVGLRSVAQVVHHGPATTGPIHSGYAAVGFTCLVLALAAPAVYWLVAFLTATGSLLGRRAVALGRALVAVGRSRGPSGRHGRRSRTR